jgi:hypothetical protein
MNVTIEVLQQNHHYCKHVMAIHKIRTHGRAAELVPERNNRPITPHYDMANAQKRTQRVAAMERANFLYSLIGWPEQSPPKRIRSENQLPVTEPSYHPFQTQCKLLKKEVQVDPNARVTRRPHNNSPEHETMPRTIVVPHSPQQRKAVARRPDRSSRESIPLAETPVANHGTMRNQCDEPWSGGWPIKGTGMKRAVEFSETVQVEHVKSDRGEKESEIMMEDGASEKVTREPDVWHPAMGSVQRASEEELVDSLVVPAETSGFKIDPSKQVFVGVEASKEVVAEVEVSKEVVAEIEVSKEVVVEVEVSKEALSI